MESYTRVCQQCSVSFFVKIFYFFPFQDMLLEACIKKKNHSAVLGKKKKTVK